MSSVRSGNIRGVHHVGVQEAKASSVTEFDPNDDPETQEQADAYINWCAENFMRLARAPNRTYRSAIRCAAWLFVVASAQLHLDEDVTANRDELLEQLAKYQALGRAIERQQVRFPVEQTIVLRASLDCWEPVGEWARCLLTAAKNAVAARLLIELHPLVDLWELQAPDVWSLLDDGTMQLASINAAEELDFADYAIRPNEAVVAKWTWQRVNNIARHAGSEPMSPN